MISHSTGPAADGATPSGTAHVVLMVPFDPVHPANPSNATQPPIRLACLAATTKALGHRVTVIDGVGEGFDTYWTWQKGFHLHGLRIAELINRVPKDADVVGVSMIFTQTYPPIRDLVRGLRRHVPDARIVIGGEGVSGIAEIVLAELPVDAVVVGEGEPPFEALLAAWGAGETASDIHGALTQENDAKLVREPWAVTAARHLDRYPDPDWSGIPLERYWTQQKAHAATPFPRTLPIIASRGCPFKCKFCTAPTTWGNQRYRSPEAVVAEMRRQIDELDVQYFTFCDLSMTTNVKWFESFLDALLEADLGTKWAAPAGVRCQRLDVAILDKAKRSGLTHLQIAPETGSEKVLKWIDKRFDHDAVDTTIRAARQVGLPVCAFLIVGYPIETMDDLLDTARYIRHIERLGVDEIAVSAFTLLPGSPWFNELRDQGLVTLDDAFYATLAQGDLSLMVSNNPRFTGAEVRAMRLQMLLWFYALRYGRNPLDLLRLARRVSTNNQQSKLDRVLRYELKSVVRGLAPVVSPASFAFLGSAAVRWARRPR